MVVLGDSMMTVPKVLPPPANSRADSPALTYLIVASDAEIVPVTLNSAPAVRLHVMMLVPKTQVPSTHHVVASTFLLLVLTSPLTTATSPILTVFSSSSHL